MKRSPGRWRGVRFTSAASLTVFAVVGALVPAGSATAQPPGAGDPADRMVGAISSEALVQTVTDLQTIADEFGDRSPGPGYEASRDYILQNLEGLGYRVTVQDFRFVRYQELSPPELETVAPPESARTYREGADADFATMGFSGSGDITAGLTLVDADLGPGNPGTGAPNDGDSDSGCSTTFVDGEPAAPKDDFVTFPEGDIALLQRGSCPFGEKAANAGAAGAAGVVVFNQGHDDDNTAAFAGSVQETIAEDLPVIGTSFGTGLELANLGADGRLRMVTDTRVSTETTQNILAETRGGDPDDVVLVGSHLDSIDDGAGINDNGSGSAGVLEIARALSEAEGTPRSKVRFAWWGAEEIGLLGSDAYVSGDADAGGSEPGLSEEEIEDISAYLNLDSIAAPNFGRFILDGEQDTLGRPVPPDSKGIAEAYRAHFDETGRYTEPEQFAGNSDYEAFQLAGIPVGGVNAGGPELKSEAQAAPDRFGGTAGEGFDPCLNDPCDVLRNDDSTLRIDAEVFEQITRATLDVLLELATGPPPPSER